MKDQEVRRITDSATGLDSQGKGVDYLDSQGFLLDIDLLIDLADRVEDEPEEGKSEEKNRSIRLCPNRTHQNECSAE